MSKKKTREEKIKASQRVNENKISYSLSFSKAEAPKKEQKHVYVYNDNKEIRRILIASAVILGLNLTLFALLTTGILHLGFLSY